MSFPFIFYLFYLFILIYHINNIQTSNKLKVDHVCKNNKEFERIFQINPIVKYCKKLDKLNREGLIEIDENNIKLSNKGIDLANLVWEEFV